MTLLSAPELGFIRLVAARRFDGPAETTEGAPPPAEGETAFARAAAVATAVLAAGHSPATRPAALLAVCAQLSLDGYELLAPQGAAAGMIAGVAAGTVTATTLARWLEDRAVAAGSQQ